MNNENSKSFSFVTEIPLPIVSIAGSTLNNNTTTTTTSTKTTPTPAQTPSNSRKQKIPQISNKSDSKFSLNSMSNADDHKSPTTNEGVAAANASAVLDTVTKKDFILPAIEKSLSKAKEGETFEESRIKDWDDCRLKKLLDEAYSYKNPRDKENKSQVFLHLLQKAEKEKEDQRFSFRAFTSCFSRNSSSTTSSGNHQHHHSVKQGGSLQDLVNEAFTESLLDCDYIGVVDHRNRHHNHHSRQKKFSSSVSSRQREGGSLPSNVNVTNGGGLLQSQAQSEHSSFIQDVKQCIGNSSNNSNTKQNRRNVKIPTAIVKESETESKSKDLNEADIDSFQETDHSKACFIHNNSNATTTTAIGDNDIEVEHSNVGTLQQKNQELKKDCLAYTDSEEFERQFDENGNSLNEIYQTGLQTATTYINMPINMTNFNTTYSTVQSQAKAKSKKKSQQDRNTKTVDVKLVAGYRGHDPVDLLVKYIENTEDKQIDPKSGKLNDNNKKKDRKKEKEKQSKINRSNSLEELRSCSKIDIDDLKRTAATTESNMVTIRNKTSSKNNKNKSFSVVDINKNFECSNGKETTSQQCVKAISSNKAIFSNQCFSSNRKSERRSWGIEEFQYLGGSKDKSNEEKLRDKKNTKSKEKEFFSPDTIDKFDTNSNSEELIFSGRDKIDKNEKSDKFDRKTSDRNLLSVDSPVEDILEKNQFNSETSEFHVVTKKKKAKKKRFLAVGDSSTTCCNNSASFNRSNSFLLNNTQRSTTSAACINAQQTQARLKCFNSQNNEPVEYSNIQHYNSPVQEVALSKNDKSRRKSTSSMPPSEKSDSSDLESIHSLPIESNKNKQRLKSPAEQVISSLILINSCAPISYADIARTNKELAVKKNSVISAEVEYSNSTNNLNTEAISANFDDTQKLSAKSKCKKTNTKTEFPDLVTAPISNFGSLPAKIGIAKNITYSLCLTSTVNSISTTKPTIEDIGKRSVATEITEADVAAGNVGGLRQQLLVQQQNHQKLQYQQKQQFQEEQKHGMPLPLKKSKSVENESYNCKKDNMKQQYPALEKPVKRHSSCNESVSTTSVFNSFESLTKNANLATRFNFAAAAKQKINTNDEALLITTSKDLLTTNNSINTTAILRKDKSINTLTSINGNSKTTQLASLIDDSTGTHTITRKNKKDKRDKKVEKSNVKDNESVRETEFEQKCKGENLESEPNQKSQLETHNLNINIEISTKLLTEHVEQKTTSLIAPKIKNLKKYPILKTGRRPAVIILNDDRNSDINNEFTFGDFKEDELILFESADLLDENYSKELEQKVNFPSTKDTTTIAFMAENLNDSGASADNLQNNTSNADTTVLLTTYDSSSPNSSFLINHYSNQSNDSGIYAINNSCSSVNGNMSNDSNVNTNVDCIFLNGENDIGGIKYTGHEKLKYTNKNITNKLNSFLNAPFIFSPASIAQKKSVYSKLETCNDIETAIIAAARAAATEKFKREQNEANFNLNLRSLSSKSFKLKKLVQQSKSTLKKSAFRSTEPDKFDDHHNNLIVNIDDVDINENDLDEKLYTQSSSYNDGLISVGNLHSTINFNLVPPNEKHVCEGVQHNVIVDFIGSAWNEIASSKVTKIYDEE